MRETKPDGRQTMRCERSELDEEFGEISVGAEAVRSVHLGLHIVGPNNGRTAPMGADF